MLLSFHPSCILYLLDTTCTSTHSALQAAAHTDRLCAAALKTLRILLCGAIIHPSSTITMVPSTLWTCASLAHIFTRPPPPCAAVFRSSSIRSRATCACTSRPFSAVRCYASGGSKNSDLVRSIRALPIKLIRVSKDSSKASQECAQEWVAKLARQVWG